MKNEIILYQSNELPERIDVKIDGELESISVVKDSLTVQKKN
jgi:hypothetical protein